MLERHRWVQERDIAWTVAAVSGSSESDVIRAYGGDPDKPIGHLAFADVPWVPDDDMGDFFYLQILTHDKHVVAIEKNGWAGLNAHLAERASQGGSFFAVYWSPVATRIVEAVKGELVADFEPLLAASLTGDGDLQPAWTSEIVFTTETLEAEMMEAMEQRTGLAFDPNWLEFELTTFRIPDPRTLQEEVEAP